MDDMIQEETEETEESEETEKKMAGYRINFDSVA